MSDSLLSPSFGVSIKSISWGKSLSQPPPWPVPLRPCILVLMTPSEMFMWLLLSFKTSWERPGTTAAQPPPPPAAPIPAVQAWPGSCHARCRPTHCKGVSFPWVSSVCSGQNWDQPDKTVRLYQAEDRAFPIILVIINSGHLQELCSSVLITPKGTERGHLAAAPDSSESNWTT